MNDIYLSDIEKTIELVKSDGDHSYGFHILKDTEDGDMFDPVYVSTVETGTSITVFSTK